VLKFPEEFADGEEIDRLERGSMEGNVAAFAFRGRMDHDVREVRGFGSRFSDEFGSTTGAVGRRVKIFIFGIGARV
jgi:hypothetical protein